MTALVLSSKTKDTSDVIAIKLGANVIKVGDLRRKFNRNSEQTNFDFEQITVESTSKPISTLIMSEVSLVSKDRTRAAIVAAQASVSDVHTFRSVADVRF